MPERSVVAGAGGFIGGFLAESLRARGDEVVAVDVKPTDEWYQHVDGAENRVLDLMDLDSCHEAVRGADRVYNLAADMGGMGFIENNKALCMLSVLINTHLLMAAEDHGVGRFFYASSACVYAADKQTEADITALAEADAYPAMPEDGYGWEKLFSERMCRHFTEDFELITRVARFHNIYGPLGTWRGGREKAPAAICRKVAEAKASGNHEIEVWGDGEQTRSFTYIDDCVEGIHRITDSDLAEPVNLGSSEMVTINQLVDLAAEIAGIEVQRNHILDAPLGVRGRNSDNTMIQRELGWAPSTTLRDGLSATYAWVESQVLDAGVPTP